MNWYVESENKGCSLNENGSNGNQINYIKFGQVQGAQVGTQIT